MQRQIIIDLVEGDDAPELPVRFEGLDLRDYSSIEMKIQKDDKTKLTATVDPDGSDYELGWVTWPAGGFERGRYKAEFELIRTSDSRTLTLPRQFPVILDVRADLG